MSWDNEPIKPHPTGERVNIEITKSSATLWGNATYIRLPKHDVELPSGATMHRYGRKSDLVDNSVDEVNITHEIHSSRLMTVNQLPGGRRMSVYGQCIKK